MKRVLAAAAFGGLLMVLAPQATAGTVTPYDQDAGQSAGDCAGKPQEAPPAPEGEAPRRGQQGDHEQPESDGGEILF